MKMMPVAMLRKVAASSKYCNCNVANRNFKENCLNHFKICHLEIMPPSAANLSLASQNILQLGIVLSGARIILTQSEKQKY